MKKILFSGTMLMALACSAPKEDKVKAPIAKEEPKELSIHGDTRIDPYYWLNQRDDQEVLDYLHAENAYTEKIMAPYKELEEKLFEEIKGRIKQTDESVPYLSNGYYYYTRYEEGKEYPIYCRKKGSLDASEEVMLNVNEMAEGYAYFAVSGLNVSPDNRFLAYGVDTVSRRQYTIHVKDLQSGEILGDRIGNTTGGSTWAGDNKNLFYTMKDDALRSFKIFRYEVGTRENEEIFHEVDETFSVGVGKTKSQKYLVIASYSTLSNEFRILDANNPKGPFRVFQPRERGLEYSIDHRGNEFFVLTNLNAKNFKLMKTSESQTSKENWKEYIPHNPQVRLMGMELFNDFTVLRERKEGLIQMRVMNHKDKSEHYLNFGEETYVAYTSVNRDMDSQILRYAYSSLTTPNSTYDYDMISKEKTLLKQDEVVGDFDPANYKAERLYATAQDGTKVPISLVYKKGFEKNGESPLLLYAYGSYGISTEPYFSSVRLSLLDRGFVYAIAHIRGGEDLGRDWYEDGKLLKKKNTFTDFIDCADHLVKNKYTSTERLFAQGGSAGGLLMGAIVNMRPDLWKGVIAAVPFVDVVTTMLDESIPLTTGEFDEWGNPKDKEYYDYMLSYSPYDNVEAKAYPNMLVTTGYHDSQVQYWEPAKWVAKLRKMKTDENILLLRTNMEAGHGGASGRFTRLKEVANEYAFILSLID